MKKFLIRCVSVLFCCMLLVGCASPKDATSAPEPPKISWEVTEDITISLNGNSFPAGTSEFVAVFENRSSDTLLYGEELSFEKLVDGQWQKLPTLENTAFNSIGYLLQSGETREFTISTWFLAAPLDAGRYRVTGSSLYIESPGSTPTQHPPYQLEFDIE